MARLLLAALAVLLTLGAPASAEREECALHAAHTGAHDERSSCGMTKLGAVEVSADKGIGEIAVHGNVAAVVQREDGLVAFLDVSDPAGPRVLSRFDTNTGNSSLDDPFDGDVVFSHDGRYVFYARQTHDWSYEGVHALDVSDPSNPRRVGYVPAGGTLRVGYYRADGVEYVVALDAIVGVMVLRFDRTTGALVPVHVDALPALKVGGPASAGVHIDPKDPRLGIPLLYVSTGRTGLDVFDFSTPAAPEKLGSWSAEGLADIEVRATPEGRRVYAATEYWFTKSRLPRIIELDATNLAAITEVARVSPSPGAYKAHDQYRVQGMSLVGDLLYVAHSHAGLGVLEGCCAAPFVRASTTDLGEGNTAGEYRKIAPHAMDVAVSGDVVFVTDASTGTLSTFRLDP